MTQEEAVSSICADARLSTKGQHADYIRCILSQLVAAELAAYRRRDAELDGLVEKWRAEADRFDSNESVEPDWFRQVADELAAALDDDNAKGGG